jgi:hypothetical protein
MSGLPLSNNELDALAERADARKGEKLLRDVSAYLARFVCYPSEHARTAHALWIMHAHCMACWESTPRLFFCSPEPASGKTRALEATEPMVPAPIEAVNVTPAYLFRKVGSEDGVTILFDEIDTVFGPKAKDNEEIRGLLNAGHRRGAVAGRCVVRGKIVETEEIPAYCAVALAGLGWLPDTLMSRSVIVRMRRRAPGEKVEPYRRREHFPIGARLRERLTAWARGVAEQLSGSWPQLPEGITDRNADVWEPLVAVADAVGGDWPTKARQAAVSLVAEATEREPSLGVRLLADLRTVFGAADTMPTDDILVGLNSMKEAPWSGLKGGPLNDRGLATRLRQYSIKSKQIRFGHRTLKAYLRSHLEDAWKRYLPSSDNSETSETKETVSNNSELPQGWSWSDVSDVSDVRIRQRRTGTHALSAASPATSTSAAWTARRCGYTETARKRGATEAFPDF